MKKILGFAGAIALSIIPTPSFSGEVEQKEMMSVTEQLLPQIGEKYYYLNKKEKKAYKKDLLKYLKKVEKIEPTGVGEAFWDDQGRSLIDERQFSGMGVGGIGVGVGDIGVGVGDFEAFR